MENDSDDDYMSEAILATCSHEDIRPGLIRNRAKQREIEIEKKKAESREKNKNLYKPLKVVESERRDEGLKTCIDEKNKGFSMLQKMGYKSGEALGKTGSGRIEPINIELKVDRTGLGRESVLKEIAERKLAARKRYLEHLKATTNVDDFRKRMTQKTQERQDEKDLRKSQRVCLDLDTKMNIEEPIEKWFWPEQEKSKTEEDEENDDEEDEAEDDEEYTFSTQEKLEILTKYLRETHLYCIWCGSVFDDEKDLCDNCPGVTRDDH